jgi:hypothetical protein
MQIQWYLQMLAPACEFCETIFLPLYRSLCNGNATGSAEDFGDISGFEFNFRVVFLGDGDKALMSEVSPGRSRGHEVFDGLAHGSLFLLNFLMTTVFENGFAGD